MEVKTLYFENPGKENTEATLKVAYQRAKQLGIKRIVLASTHGYTAKMAKKIFGDSDIEIIAVSISPTFSEEGWAMTPSERKELQDMGITVLTCMHALGDDVSEAFGTNAPNRIVRETLYRFCQGMKVAVEIAIMAADAGLIFPSEEVIAIAGTGTGADTAIVVKPAYARKFDEFEIREILAKPRNA